MNFLASRTWLMHLGLFLMVYAACLFHYWTLEQSQPQSGQWVDTLQGIFSRETTASKQVARDRVESPMQRDVSSQPRSTAIGTTEPAREQIDPVTPLEPTNSLSEETRQEVNTLSTQATSASEPGERAKAIVKLRNAARTEESVQALVSVLGGDQSGQNRMFAVTSLLNMARRGDEDGAIKAALRRATSDEDVRVAARARQALDALSEVVVAAE